MPRAEDGRGPSTSISKLNSFVCLLPLWCSPPQPVCLFALVHRSDITDVVFCMASGRLDTLICFDPDDAMLDQIFILSSLFNQCVYGQSKCSIGILPTEVGLEAGYNLLPVMEDKNLLAMYTTQATLHLAIATNS